ncbi:DMT family transporter [Ralstonia sp. UBA689]|uniref:DMT family transporter n=1 Tax=Ralstonia sp. UBA689 TaxID=1947373 RepID=UPI0025E23403|nr:DMT family transporter [Ralstonia sp. UBA689]
MSVLYPLLAVLIWAANTIVSKAAAGVLDPAAISLYRWLLAALVLTPFCARPLWRQRQAVLAQWKRFAVLALLGMVMYQCLAYYAAHSTSATNMGVIGALIPMLGLILNVVVFRQPVGAQAVIGVVVSLAGVLYLLGRGHPGALLDGGVNRGDVLILIGATSYALYNILYRRWAQPFGQWLNLYVQVLLAVVMLVPLALTAQSLAIPPQGIGLVVFAGIASSIVASYLWMLGLKRIGSERTAVLMNLMPVFTAAMAALILGETVHGYHWIGGGFVLLGVSLAQGIVRLPLRRSGLSPR